MTRNIQGVGPPDRVWRRIGWSGAWLAALALPMWGTRLALVWVLVAAAGALAWTVPLAVARRRGVVELAAAAMIWTAIGLASGVQLRLTEIAADWPRLRGQVEDRAAEALNAALDGLVLAGEEAVSAVERVVPEGRAPGAEVFAALERIRAEQDVSALAVFTGRGAPLAWSGEHRGALPLSARLGRQTYVYFEGPLFSYVYFTRPLEGGRTAVAAVLVESALPSDPADLPFAERFESRYGLMPRFSLPRRAQGEAVWDWTADVPILSVSFDALGQQQWWERVVERGRSAAGVVWLMAMACLVIAWYRTGQARPGIPIAVSTAALVLAPLGQMAGTGELFSPLRFVLPGPGDITLGMLLVILGGATVWILTRVASAPARRVPLALGIAVAAAVPVAVVALSHRSASHGILASTLAGGFALQLVTVLAIAVPYYLLLRAVRVDAPRRPILLLGGHLLALALAIFLAVWWLPGREVLPWSAALWAIPLAIIIVGAGSGDGGGAGFRGWMSAGLLASSIALPHLWVMHSAAELENAEGELSMLGTQTDPFLDFLLRRFADATRRYASDGEGGVNLLYRPWVESGLAAAGYEAHLTGWRNGRVESQLVLSSVDSLPDVVRETVGEIGPDDDPIVTIYPDIPELHYLLRVPIPDGRVITVAVPPRMQLGRSTALARFLQPTEPETAGSERVLYLIPASPGDTLLGDPDAVSWTRTEAGWRSEARAHFPTGWMHAHLFIRTPSFPILIVRAMLATAALLGAGAVLWLLARVLCGDATRFGPMRDEWLRSFRGRLTITLFLFFLLPTVVFGAVAYGAVAREVVISAAGQAQRTLEQAAPAAAREPLPVVGERVGSDLLLYRDGLLAAAGAPETIDLGLFHGWLPPPVYLDFASGEDTEAQESRRVGENEYLVAYRRLDDERVLAAPIPLASREITRRQGEFRDMALLVSLLGAGLSVVLSLFVARALSRPLAELSQAAATVGRGDLDVRLPDRALDEFGSVHHSFNRMVERLHRARADLAREARRTEAIVDAAATGVLALDADGRVELVNPRAAEILEADLVRGDPLPERPGFNAELLAALDEFRRSAAAEASREFEIDNRIVRVRLRKLSGADGPRGTVVALEDVTREVRTARVLAWGEMARQVAHEIKNPLTPIKLSVQHIRRAYADDRPDFDEILDRNVQAALEEIDRLGEIARAFARFGTPQQTSVPLDDVDVARTVGEVLTLYRGGGPSSIDVAVSAPPAGEVHAVARVGELKEVLVNLLENSREAIDEDGRVEIGVTADDGWVEIEVRDDGEGIPPDQLQRVFEPQFSTRSSGTGLGLAIVKRLVESWGGTVEAVSEEGAGTRVILRLRRVTDGTRFARTGEASHDS